MSKRIFVSIACLGIFWIVGANAERTVVYGDEPPTPSNAPTPATTVQEPTPQAIPQTVQDPPAKPPQYFEDSDVGRKLRAEERDRMLQQARDAARFRETLDNSASSPRTAGKFTVVTGDKRSILVNTTTGDSWLLMIDNPGSHWEPIAKGVSKGGKTEISWSAAPAGVADVQPAASDARLAKHNEELGKKYAVLGYKFAEQQGLIRQRDMEFASLNVQLKDTRKDLDSAKQRNEVLEKQLKESKDALNARDKEAQADVIDASQVK